MNETILSKTTQMLLRERLDRAERARVVRSALDHRAARKARRVKARRSTCRKSEQAAY
jgi:hypothetical protein